MENNENVEDIQDVQEADVLQETITQEEDVKNHVKIEDFADLIPDDDDEQEDEDEYSEQKDEYSEQEGNTETPKRTMMPDDTPSKEVAESVVCLFEFATELVYNLTILKNYEIPADYDVYTPRERKNLSKVFEQLLKANPTVQKYLSPTVNAGLVMVGVLLSSIGRIKKLKRKLEKEEQEKQSQSNVLPLYVMQNKETQPQKKRGRPKKS